MTITAASGFAFMVGYYGLPFVISLFLQQHRGLTAPADRLGVPADDAHRAGAHAVLGPSRRTTGRKTIIVSGLALMTAGLAVSVCCPPRPRCGCSPLLMVLVGLGGPPCPHRPQPSCSTPLPTVRPASRPGCSTPAARSAERSRSPFSAACSAHPGTFVRGVHTSLLIAAGVLAVTAVLALFLPASKSIHDRQPNSADLVVLGACANSAPPTRSMSTRLTRRKPPAFVPI